MTDPVLSKLMKQKVELEKAFTDILISEFSSYFGKPVMISGITFDDVVSLYFHKKSENKVAHRGYSRKAIGKIIFGSNEEFRNWFAKESFEITEELYPEIEDEIDDDLDICHYDWEIHGVVRYCDCDDDSRYECSMDI